MELHYLRHVRDYKLETRFPKKRETDHIYDDPDVLEKREATHRRGTATLNDS